MSKTWLITGASSGLGAALAHHVLRAGHKVVGAVRNITKAQQSYPHFEELGGMWAQLDVTDPKTKEHVARLSREHEGFDVVVNNAGYSILGSFEDMNETEIHQQIDTNLYGPIRVIQGCLPSMRENKTGCIVSISSVAGLIGRPATALYSASKFGLSESLAAELAEFGIRVLIVQPGGFRTGFLSAYVKLAAGLNPAYEGTALGQAIQRYDTVDGTQRGDLEKAAARIVDAVEQQGLCAETASYLRMPLGSDCYAVLRAKVDGLKENMDNMEVIAHSTDYPQ
ncbi:putative short chain oxidoreductase/dehydrogenase [Aspergillus indologenus CBS 114.80]|uniref:Putative short chain oxidoreductase/dehydrogenase n=1 Tax=Aspergillus indologenus CBS 114.80 TaxID=1450541 RepID=A0A2V5IDH2_9EURO|nr:putative short chain oxidoreductase/dehydrogenase [Aspergillus indologenus CBS 114.80]